MAIYMKKELLKKCENIDDPNIINTYKVLLELMDKKKVKVEEKEESYLENSRKDKNHQTSQECWNSPLK